MTTEQIAEELRRQLHDARDTLNRIRAAPSWHVSRQDGMSHARRARLTEYHKGRAAGLEHMLRFIADYIPPPEGDDQ